MSNGTHQEGPIATILGTLDTGRSSGQGTPRITAG